MCADLLVVHLPLHYPYLQATLSPSRTSSLPCRALQHRPQLLQRPPSFLLHRTKPQDWEAATYLPRRALLAGGTSRTLRRSPPLRAWASSPRAIRGSVEG